MKPSAKRLLVCLAVPPVTGVTLAYAAVFIYLNIADAYRPLPTIRFSIPAYLVSILLIFAITLLPSLLLAFLYERFLFARSRGKGAPLPVFGVTVPFGALLGLLLVYLTSSQSVTIFLMMMVALGAVMGAVTACAALAVGRKERATASANEHSSSEPSP